MGEASDRGQGVTDTPAGWYPDPEQAQTQRYWDGERWAEQRAPLAPAHSPLISPRRLRRIVAMAIVAVSLFYFTGHLDHLLYPVGLNMNECGKNSFGSVYCGDELTEYRQRVQQPIESAQGKLREAEREANEILGR